MIVSRYKQDQSKQKQLGAVYTPARIAGALARWAIRDKAATVLDPACGDGAFLLAARVRLAELGAKKTTCVGVDIDETAAKLAGGTVADFFEWANTSRRFDVILTNPPYIRSHLFPERSRKLAFDLMRNQGLTPSRLMSTWAPFLAISEQLCSPTGRMAFVLPEELLHVSYVAELRQYLLKRFHGVVVCLPSANIFPEVQQSTVLALCDRTDETASGLAIIDFSALENGNYAQAAPAPIWPFTEKWTHFFLTPQEREEITECREILAWKPLSDYGRVEVGVVTGANEFFLLSQSNPIARGGSYLEPIVASAKDLGGIRYGTTDHAETAARERPAYLLMIPPLHNGLPATVTEYLEEGRKQGIHQRYKCGIRDPWYSVPSVWPAHALLLRQADELPRLVHLSMECTATDTIHRVRWRNRTDGKRLCAAFLNSWTLLNCELMGRSYGGGVLELMPSEANALPVPEPDSRYDTIFNQVDQVIRRREFKEAVRLVDEHVFAGVLPNRRVQRLRRIWARLVQRRRSNRKNASV